jgi:hypothetical protein
MAAYLILGAGKFGRLALERLAALDRDAAFLVVDRDQAALAAIRTVPGPPVHYVAFDAIDFLLENLGHPAPWNWIVPVVPGHVAFSWLMGRSAAAGWEPVALPPAVGQLAPGAWPAPEGGFYLSRARHRCPDDCSESAPVCPVSGESREVPLHQELAAIELPGFRTRVLATRQLAPGVGGYTPGQLLELAAALEEEKMTQVLIATACRCHGVAQGLARVPRSKGV